jgi:hypothetical protein
MNKKTLSFKRMFVLAAAFFMEKAGDPNKLSDRQANILTSQSKIVAEYLAWCMENNHRI